MLPCGLPPPALGLCGVLRTNRRRGGAGRGVKGGCSLGEKPGQTALDAARPPGCDAAGRGRGAGHAGARLFGRPGFATPAPLLAARYSIVIAFGTLDDAQADAGERRSLTVAHLHHAPLPTLPPSRPPSLLLHPRAGRRQCVGLWEGCWDALHAAVWPEPHSWIGVTLVRGGDPPLPAVPHAILPLLLPRRLARVAAPAGGAAATSQHSLQPQVRLVQPLSEQFDGMMTTHLERAGAPSDSMCSVKHGCANRKQTQGGTNPCMFQLLSGFC